VLRAVVREYVKDDKPVGSETVRARHHVRASSATIRLDMAALSEMGLFSQPHSSSGRIPTASGYRAYVRHLPSPRLDSRGEVLLRAPLRKAQDLTEALAMVTRALADLTQLVALATPPIAGGLRLDSVKLRHVSAQMVLLAYSLSDGTRGEALVPLQDAAPAHSVDEWRRALEGLEPIGVESLAASAPPAVPEPVWRALVEDILRHVGMLVISQGASHLATKPEFSTHLSLADLLALIGNPGRAYALLTRVQPGQETRTLIDGADTGDQLRDCALVVGSFGGEASRSGRVAVLGHMRMHYDRSIAATAHAAGLLDDAWARRSEEPEG